MKSMLECEACGSDKSVVTDSRKRAGVIIRRRSCVKCGRKFTTYEVHEADFVQLKRSMQCLNTIRGMAERILDIVPLSERDGEKNGEGEGIGGNPAGGTGTG